MEVTGDGVRVTSPPTRGADGPLATGCPPEILRTAMTGRVTRRSCPLSPA
jgi:hypothetical protein